MYVPIGDDMLEKLEGIDVELGMSYCMDDEDFYREVLEEYVTADKTEELKHFFELQDWDSYRIRIHAVKSSSMTIGASELSAKALEIESACKAHDAETIMRRHEDCLNDYQRVLGIVRNALA